jgi:SpoVK/Ycf46/Vps4 family AAA+-type ATPase
MLEFDKRVVPTRGLDEVIVDTATRQALLEIVSYGKASSVLFSQWGFAKQHGKSQGIAALFYGKPGTGKTIAAEALGFDLGKPLKVVNCAQLVSKWVGETGKNIQAVFDEAKSIDSVLVFDEAEGLFGSRACGGEERGGGSGGGGSARHDTMNVGILLQNIETFPGLCIVITNHRDSIDNAFFRRFKFVLEFTSPSPDLREKLWRLLIPQECPLSDDVDLATLARRFEFSGGSIKSTVFRAAARASLRTNDDRMIKHADLLQSCQEEQAKDKSKDGGTHSMYS